MSRVRVYIKGEGLEAKSDFSSQLLLPTGRKLTAYNDEGGPYIEFDVHAGSVIIPEQVRKQITRATMKEEITDTQLCFELKRGEYVRPNEQGAELHATVLGRRHVHGGFSSDQVEVQIFVTIEISADTPENALQLFQDILAGAIKPFRPYGRKNPAGSPIDSE